MKNAQNTGRKDMSWRVRDKLCGFVVEPSKARYEIYCTFADDGNGGDINRQGKPLKSYDEWLNS